MSKIGPVIKKTPPCVLQMSCLSTTTAEQLQDALWRKIGLWIPVEQCSVKSDDSGKNFTALVVVDRVNFAEAMSLWLESVGEHIVVKPAVARREHPLSNKQQRAVEKRPAAYQQPC